LASTAIRSLAATLSQVASRDMLSQRNGAFKTSDTMIKEAAMEYDGIIVGGGHNGLICASYLTVMRTLAT